MSKHQPLLEGVMPSAQTKEPKAQGAAALLSESHLDERLFTDPHAIARFGQIEGLNGASDPLVEVSS